MIKLLHYFFITPVLSDGCTRSRCIKSNQNWICDRDVAFYFSVFSSLRVFYCHKKFKDVECCRRCCKSASKHDDYFFYNATKIPLHFGSGSVNICLIIIDNILVLPKVVKSIFKQFTESTETTKLDKQFHTLTILFCGHHTELQCST